MSDAPSDLRRMLDTARGLDAPAGVDRERMLQQLLTDVARPAAPRAVRAPHLAVAGLGVALVALVALGLWPRAGSRPLARAPVTSPPVVAPLVAAPGVAPEPPHETPVVSPSLSPSVSPSVAPHVAERSSVASAVPRRASTPPASAQEDEWRIIREADRALRSHDPDFALAVLARHATQHPRGVAAPEVLAYRVRAYCMAGRHAEALTVARELRTRAPDSPAAYSLRATCASQP